MLLVEVHGDHAQERMTQGLADHGVAAATRGGLLTVDAGAGSTDIHDLIRDTAADLGLGLVRLQVDHRRIEDVFADTREASDV